MGGSAIGGSLARAVLGDRAIRPIVLGRGYALPAWATPETTVLCSSYSGDTEETLAVFEAAGALGARRVVATTGGKLAVAARADGVPVIPLPGGFQPRSAVAYSLVVALEVAAWPAGRRPPFRDRRRRGPRRPADGRMGAGRRRRRAGQGPRPQLLGTMPVDGAGLTAAVAYRWKTQINENAKLPCFAAELPELDHNEIVGWEGAAELGRFSAVFLDDSDLHPRIKTRIALSRELIEPHAAVAVTVASEGETRIERLVSLVVLGDLVSLYLAVLRGVDPAQITALDKLKAALATADRAPARPAHLAGPQTLTRAW